MKMKKLSEEDSWYVPDLGPAVPLPDNFYITINNMEDACIEADKFAQELAEVTIKEINKKDIVV
jgi:hypothetical protein